MALGTEVGDAYISVHADTTPFRLDIAKLNRVMGTSIKRNNELADAMERVNKATKDHTKVANKDRDTIRRLGDEHVTTSKKVDESRSIFERFADNVHDRWRRMDTTVRLVLTLILAAGPQMATLGSVMSSALLGVAAAATAAVVALSPLMGLIAPLIVSIGAFSSSLDEIKEQWKSFTEAIQSNALAGIGQRLADSFGPLFDALLKIASPEVFKAIGDPLIGILGTLTTTLEDAFGPLTNALTGPLADAFETLGSALTGPLLDAFLTFITETAPFAAELADMFYAWADGVAQFFAAAAESGELDAFFESLMPALQATLGFFGAIKDVLGGLFTASIGPGTAFLEILTDLIQKFADWLNSVEGQNRMAEFFQNLFAVLPSLVELIGSAATAIADLVTPEAVEATVGLLEALSDIMPILSDVISLLANAGVIDVLAAALVALGEIITPLIKPVGDFLSILSGEIIGILETLAPEFEMLGEALGVLFTALTPLLPILADLITQVAQGLGPVFQKVVPLVAGLIGQLIPIIGQIADVVGPLIPVIIDLGMQLLNALWPAFEALIPAISRVIETMAPFITQLIEMLAPVLVPIIDAVVQLAVTLLDILVPVLDALLPILLILIETALVPLMATFKVLMPVIVTLIDAALTPLTILFEELAPIIKGFAEIIQRAMNTAIIPIINTIGDWIQKNNFVRDAIQFVMDKVKNFVTVITNAKDKVVDFVDGMWERIKGFKGDVIGVFEAIGSGIENAFKSAFNYVARVWNNTVGELDFTVPNWVPVIGGSTYQVPKIPYFARGTIANQATLGVFGEAGREALVPLDRPLSQIDPAVRDIAAFAQGKGGNTANVNINTAASDPHIIASILEDVLIDGWR